MSTEEELREKVAEVTRRIATYELQEATIPSSRENSHTILQTAIPRAKPDQFSDGNWSEWISHFGLCVKANGWNEDQSCQQLALSLRGRAQRVYLTLKGEEQNTYQLLVRSIEEKLEPQKQRQVRK